MAASPGATAVQDADMMLRILAFQAEDEPLTTAVAKGAKYQSKLNSNELFNVKQVLNGKIANHEQLKYSEARDCFRHNSFYLIGGAGCGKSSLLRSLVTKLYPGRTIYVAPTKTAGEQLIELLGLRRSVFPTLKECGSITLNQMYSGIPVFQEHQYAEENSPKLSSMSQYSEYVFKMFKACEPAVNVTVNYVVKKNYDFFQKLKSVTDEYCKLEQKETVDIDEFVDWLIEIRKSPAVPQILKMKACVLDEFCRVSAASCIMPVFVFYAIRAFLIKKDKRFKMSHCPTMVYVGSPTQSSVVSSVKGVESIVGLFSQNWFMRHLEEIGSVGSFFKLIGVHRVFMNRRLTAFGSLDQFYAYQCVCAALELGEIRISKAIYRSFVKAFVTVTLDQFADPTFRTDALRVAKYHEHLKKYKDNIRNEAPPEKHLTVTQYVCFLDPTSNEIKNVDSAYREIMLNETELEEGEEYEGYHHPETATDDEEYFSLSWDGSLSAFPSSSPRSTFQVTGQNPIPYKPARLKPVRLDPTNTEDFRTIVDDRTTSYEPTDTELRDMFRTQDSQIKNEQLSSFEKLGKLNIRFTNFEIEELQHDFIPERGLIKRRSETTGKTKTIKPFVACRTFDCYRLTREYLVGAPCYVTGQQYGYIIRFIGGRTKYVKCIEELGILVRANVSENTLLFFYVLGERFMSYYDISMPRGASDLDSEDPASVAEMDSSVDEEKGGKKQKVRGDTREHQLRSLISFIATQLKSVHFDDEKEHEFVLESSSVTKGKHQRFYGLTIPTGTLGKIRRRYNGSGGVLGVTTAETRSGLVWNVRKPLDWYWFTKAWLRRGSMEVEFFDCLSCWIPDEVSHRFRPDCNRSKEEETEFRRPMDSSEDECDGDEEEEAGGKRGKKQQQQRHPLPIAKDNNKLVLIASPIMNDYTRTTDTLQGSTYPNHYILNLLPLGKKKVSAKDVLVGITRCPDLRYLSIVDGGVFETKRFSELTVSSSSNSDDDEEIELNVSPSQDTWQTRAVLQNVIRLCAKRGILGVKKDAKENRHPERNTPKRKRAALESSEAQGRSPRKRCR